MIVPMVSIPPSIANGLEGYRDLFPRSETFQHIQEYCTGMVVLDKPSIQRMSRCFVDGPYTADRSNPPQNAAQIPQIAVSFVSEAQSASRFALNVLSDYVIIRSPVNTAILNDCRARYDGGTCSYVALRDSTR